VSERTQRALLLAPVALGALVLVVLPATITFAEALFSDDLVGPPRFVGLDNFTSLATDPVFREVLGTSAVFLAITVPIRVGGALALALLLHRPRRGAGLQRGAVMLPAFVPDVAIVVTFGFLLNPVYGPVNGLLGLLGAPQPAWFAAPGASLAGIVVVTAFSLGEGFLVALAARRQLPEELFEAARLEGASAWHAFRRITLPLLVPVLGLLAARDLAVALQASFVPTYLLTDGGPDRATLLLPIHIYDVAFEQLRYGYAAAMTVVMVVLTAVIVLVQWRLLRRWRLDLG